MANADHSADLKRCTDCRNACISYCVDRQWELLPIATVEGTIIESSEPVRCDTICSDDKSKSVYLRDDVSARAGDQCCKYEGGGQRTSTRPSNIVEPTPDPACMSKCDQRECALYGCTHSFATNYNPKATRDDGTCVFGGECTDFIVGSGFGIDSFFPPPPRTTIAQQDCRMYELQGWCNKTGEGPGWNSEDWGSIDQYFAPNGRTPIDACCACGGGRVVNRTAELTVASATALHSMDRCLDYEWHYFPWEAHENHQSTLGDQSLEGIYDSVDQAGPFGTCNDTDIAVINAACESLFDSTNALGVGWEKYSIISEGYYDVAPLCDGPGRACKEIFMAYYPACNNSFNATEPTMDEWATVADSFVNACGSLVGCDSICASTASNRVNALPSWLSTDVHASNGRGRRADESCCCFGGGTAGCARCHLQCDEMYGNDRDACNMKCDNSGVCDFVTDIDPQASCDGVEIEQQWYPTPELRRGASAEARCLAKSDKRKPVQCFYDQDTQECTEISECQICQANVGADGSGNPVGPLAQKFNLDCACKCGDVQACGHCAVTGCELDTESPLAGTRQVCGSDGQCRGTWQNCWYRCETEDSFLKTCARELASSRPEGFDQPKCDVELCKQNCDCRKGRFAGDHERFDLTAPFGDEETPWTSKMCRSVCPLVTCNDGDICSEDSRQCESRMEISMEVTAPTGGSEALANDELFKTSFKTALADRLQVDPHQIIITSITDARRRLQNTVASNDTHHVTVRQLQAAGSVRIDFAIQVPVAVFSHSVENVNTAAEHNQPMEIQSSSGVLQASAATMRAAVTWEQYTADAQRIVLDTLRDCNEHDQIYIFEGPWNKNTGMFITIEVGAEMWDDPLCAGPEPPDGCSSSSFNDFRTKAYEGATVNLKTCASTTQAGANLIAAATGLTTYSPLYATSRGASGAPVIEVVDALAGVDPYDETQQARRACIIQASLADAMPDRLREQMESKLCCASGTYTPAALRQQLKAPADRTDLASYGKTTVYLECLSEEGCSRLSFQMQCQAGIDCADPESIRKQYAYGEWGGDVEALKSVETSTTSDAKLRVKIINTGSYDLSVAPPSGNDKPPWISVELYENNRPVSFTSDVSLPSNTEREIGLTFMGSKKPPTGRSDDQVFFPTSGASECNRSKIVDRQGRLRNGMKLTVSLETQEVPLTAIAIPSMVEVEVRAGEEAETELALYNVQDFWTTWFIRSCASRDVCKRVTGDSEGMKLLVGADGQPEDKPLSTRQHPCGNVESCLIQVGQVRFITRRIWLLTM